MSKPTMSPAQSGPRGIRAMSSIAMGVALALGSLGPQSAEAAPEPTPEAQQILDQDPAVDYLGTPVTTQIPSQAAQGVEEGAHVSYRMFKGNPSSGYPTTFAVTDVETGETLFTCDIEGAEHARYVTSSNDGKVYWSTYYDSGFGYYDPETRECNDFGETDPNYDNTQAFGMGPGPDGSVYVGAYPESRLYQYHPETDEMELLQAQIDEDAEYIHSTQYHEETDSVYVTTGGQVPKIYRIPDGGRGEPTLLVSEENAPGLNDASPNFGRMNIVHDRIIAQINLQLLVADLDGNILHWEPEQTRTFFGHHAIAGAEPGQVIFSGDQGEMMAYDVETNQTSELGFNIGGYLSNGVIDDSSGTPLLYGSSVDTVFVANLETNEIVSQNQLEFEQPTLIQKLFHGPDDTVWASGYMSGLSVVDKEGDNHSATLDVGQYESAAVRGDEFYIGSYGHAALSRLAEMPVDGSAPVFDRLLDGQAEGQDRPFGMAYNPDRDELYMGSVALYGRTQGGLLIHDPETDESLWLTEEIGENENIVSLAYNEHDQKLYIGSTVDGGLGSDPSGNTAGKLIVFDPETRTVEQTIDPAGEEREGITGLLVDGEGIVWGVAEQSLFAYDPATGESEIKAEVASEYAEDTTYWAYGYLHESPADGNIYGTAGGRLFKYDTAAEEATQLISGANWSTVDDAGDVYFSSEAMLFRYNVEGGDPGACEISAASAGTKLVGNSTSVWGTADGCENEAIAVEVQQDSEWVTAGETTAGEDGFYAVNVDAATASAGEHSLRARVGDAISEPVSLTRVPRTTQTAADATPVGRVAQVWGTVSDDATVSTQVWIAGRGWVTSQTREVSGGYVVPLTYGQHAAGEYRWRLKVAHEHGEVEYTEPFDQRRLGPPTATSAESAPAGRTANVWGTIAGNPNVAVWTEVQLPDGRWVRSNVGTTDDAGGYVLELTYGKHTPGSYRWRVGSQYEGIGTLHSEPITLQRR